MGKQYIYSIIYISGVVFGILHCYPLLGEDSESPDRLDSDVIEGLHPNIVSSPRLQRLVKTFTRLVQLESQGHGTSSGPGIQSFFKPDGQWEVNNAIGDGQASSSLNDDVSDDASRSKRQQGWYIQYGKRGADITTEAALMDSPNHFTKSSSSSLQSSEFRRQVTELMASVLKDIFILANEEQRGDGQNSRSEDGLDIADQLAEPSHLTKDKRQQGWYTPYGKRSNQDFVRL